MPFEHTSFWLRDVYSAFVFRAPRNFDSYLQYVLPYKHKQDLPIKPILALEFKLYYLCRRSAFAGVLLWVASL